MPRLPRTRTTALFAAAALLAAALAVEARATDDFYKARLQEGRIAFETGNTAEAADLLRIGCFGLMDQPALHAEGLVWLALAQQKLGRTTDVDATVRRFLEVEKRFGAYSKAVLPAEVRKPFEELLARRVPPETLLSLPALVRLVETEDQKLAKLPPKERKRALEAKAAADPANAAWPLALARVASETAEHKDAARWAGKVLELDAKNVEARRLRARALVARRSYAEALADLGELPAAAFDAEPALKADRFVCLAATKRWDDARAALQGLPEELLARPDVASATKKLPRVVAAAPETPTAPPEAATQAAGAGAPAAATPAVNAPAVNAPAAAMPAQATATPAETRAVAPHPAATAPAAAAPAPQAPSAREAQAAAAAFETKAQIRDALKAGAPERAKALALALVAARPDDREARKLLLEAACMARDWKTVAAQGRLLEPFHDGEEPSMFYTAVGFYETGSRDSAKALMQRARPRIAATPFVNWYAERLLREGTAE